jgi:2-phosphosulfolactate phosphatase
MTFPSSPRSVSSTVHRRSLLSGATGARGVAIIIDVLRAFSCAALMFRFGITELVLVRTPEQALAYRDRHPGALAAGEVKGEMVKGFDLGNSPREIVEKGQAFFAGRAIVLRSSAGTQGALEASLTADRVVLGSYMTAAATARYVRGAGSPDTMATIVAMGFEGVEASVEDERCGDYLEHLLSGTPYDHLSALWECMNEPSIANSLRGEHPYRCREDVILALERDLFDFAMVGRLVNGGVRVTRVDA